MHPFGGHPDEMLPQADRIAFTLIGEEATRHTGYPSGSMFEQFQTHAATGLSGTAEDWLYDYRGIFAWATELWNPARAAGIRMQNHFQWLFSHPPEDALQLLRWSDENLEGALFVDWYPFDHPQLGEVELGGWNLTNCFFNLPLPVRGAEFDRNSRFAITLALALPRLALHGVYVEPRTPEVQRVVVTVDNAGFLPTNVTTRAIERGLVEGVRLELALPPAARLLEGDASVVVGELDGRLERRNTLGFDDDSTTDRAVVEWLVEAPSGGSVTVSASHPRAGRTVATGELRTTTTPRDRQ
jgi:hypothetical protein